ncbi:MAG: RNA polymerase sigma factor [Ilumatobacteraceae bacterium]
MGQAELGIDQFDELYRRELVSIATLATALTGNRDTGADIAQEALLRAYRSWSTVSTMDRPGAWVRRIAINLATDARRKRSREAHALERIEARPVGGAAGWSDGSFWQEVRRLPERQRTAIALRYIDDFTVDEIAEIMQISGGTVKATLFKARQSLAAALGATEVDDADDR